MALSIVANPLIDGVADGPAMVLSAPISFWGGVNPTSGLIVQAAHPERGQCIAGRVLCLPELIGSSSSSAVMLELLHAGMAPRALLLASRDAILPLGVIVAEEMGWPTIPVLECDLVGIVNGDGVTVSAGGGVTVERAG